MLKTIIVLPDGTEVSSGTGVVNAIRCVTLTECVNRGEELTIGSTCANAVTLFAEIRHLRGFVKARTYSVSHKISYHRVTACLDIPLNC